MGEFGVPRQGALLQSERDCRGALHLVPLTLQGVEGSQFNLVLDELFASRIIG